MTCGRIKIQKRHQERFYSNVCIQYTFWEEQNRINCVCKCQQRNKIYEAEPAKKHDKLVPSHVAKINILYLSCFAHITHCTVRKNLRWLLNFGVGISPFFLFADAKENESAILIYKSKALDIFKAI